MADGHLNKCKECTKADVKRNYERKSADETWMEKERARGREKFKRLDYANRGFKQTLKDFPGTYNTNRTLRHHGYDTKGKEAHHWNYNLPLSVFLMSRKAHHRIHTFISMNRDDKYGYTKDGVRIETPQQAKDIYDNILAQCGINEKIQLIEL